MIVTIRVYLPDEDVDCWFPARAEHLGGDRYRLIDPSPEDPVLEFNQGDVVRCRTRTLSVDGGRQHECLVAYEKIAD